MSNGSAGEQAIRQFTQGLTGGIALRTQLNEQKAKVDARLVEIEKGKKDDAMNKLTLGAKYIAIPGMEDFGRNLANEGSIALTGQGLSPEQMAGVGNKLDTHIKDMGKLNESFNDPKSPIYQNMERWAIGAENIRGKATATFGAGSEREKGALAGIERQEETFVSGQEATQAGLAAQRAQLGQVDPTQFGAIEEAGQLPELRRQQIEAAALGGTAGAKFLEAPKAPTLTEMKAEILSNLPPEEKKRFLLKPEVEINLGKPASAGERTAIAETRASIDALNNLKSLFDNEFVGPAGGRIGAIKNVFGLNPAKQEAFIAATSAFKNQVIKQITGAQMSEQEAERIMKQIPTETDAPSVWLAKFEQSIKNLKTVNDRRQEVLRQSGIRSPEDLQEGSVEDLSTLSNEELLKRLTQ